MNKIQCEIYSRVCGYFRPVANFNLGQQEQFWNRRTISLEASQTALERRSDELK